MNVYHDLAAHHHYRVAVARWRRRLLGRTGTVVVSYTLLPGAQEPFMPMTVRTQAMCDMPPFGCPAFGATVILFCPAVDSAVLVAGEMQTSMFRLRHDLKVLGTIIAVQPVAMMHDEIRSEVSTKHLFRDQPMLSDIAMTICARMKRLVKIDVTTRDNRGSFFASPASVNTHAGERTVAGTRAVLATLIGAPTHDTRQSNAGVVVWAFADLRGVLAGARAIPRSSTATELHAECRTTMLADALYATGVCRAHTGPITELRPRWLAVKASAAILAATRGNLLGHRSQSLRCRAGGVTSAARPSYVQKARPPANFTTWRTA